MYPLVPRVGCPRALSLDLVVIATTGHSTPQKQKHGRKHTLRFRYSVRPYDAQKKKQSATHSNKFQLTGLLETNKTSLYLYTQVDSVGVHTRIQVIGHATTRICIQNLWFKPSETNFNSFKIAIILLQSLTYLTQHRKFI